MRAAILCLALSSFSSFALDPCGGSDDTTPADTGAAHDTMVKDTAAKDSTAKDTASADLVGKEAGQVDKGAAGEAVFSDGYTLIIGLEFNSKGDLIVSDYGAGTLYTVSSSGAKTSLATLKAASGLAIDESDNIWVVAEDTKTVSKVSPAGAVTTVATLSSSPRDITYDPDNKVFFVICDGNIFKVTPTGTVTSFGKTPYSTGAALEYDTHAKKLYGAGGTLFGFDSSGTATTFASVMITRGLTHDGQGNLYGGQGAKVFKISATGAVTQPYTVTTTGTGVKYGMVRDLAIKGATIYVTYGTRIIRF